MSRTTLVSSMLRSVGYEAATGRMEVEFVSGAVYQYERVPDTVFQGLMRAESHGRYFTEHVRRAAYGYERVAS